MAVRWNVNGKKCYIHELEHQHLSCLYYFIQYIDTNGKIPTEVFDEVLRVLDEKFSGVILPYCPLVNHQEIKKLYQLKMLEYDKESHKYNIINDNKEWIGEIILTTNDQVNSTTGEYLGQKSKEDLLKQIMDEDGYYYTDKELCEECDIEEEEIGDEEEDEGNDWREPDSVIQTEGSFDDVDPPLKLWNEDNPVWRTYGGDSVDQGDINKTMFEWIMNNFTDKDGKIINKDTNYDGLGAY